MINKSYYDNIHYAWCTPHFSYDSLPKIDNITPPSSSPAGIYFDLYNAIKHGDHHNARIQQNKIGILKGANIRLKQGAIDEEKYKEISSIVNATELTDFRPLLYVMPFTLVSNIIRRVPISEKAHPLSIEYIIDYLPKEFFEVIEFNWS